jgi:hypothetical protein
MLRRGTILGGIVVALTVAAVSAQEQPAPRQRGFGGPGNMRIPLAMLIVMPEVQTELALSDDQKQQVEQLSADLMQQARSTFANINFRDIMSLSEEERTKRFSELRTKAEETGKQADGKVEKLVDSKQLARLGQLRLQREGVGALSRPEVVKQLALSDEQQAKIKKIADESRGQGGFGRGGGRPGASQPDRQALIARAQEQRKKAMTDALAVLDDDQLLRWPR